MEEKFGIGKRKYAWDCVKEKLPETSITKIHLVALVMNIDKILRDFIFVLIFLFESVAWNMKLEDSRSA